MGYVRCFRRKLVEDGPCWRMSCNEQGACTCLGCSRQLHAGVSPLVTGEKQKREKTMTFQEQKRVHMEWRVILVSYPAPLSSDHAFRRTHWFECRGICIGYLCMDRLFLCFGTATW